MSIIIIIHGQSNKFQLLIKPSTPIWATSQECVVMESVLSRRVHKGTFPCVSDGLAYWHTDKAVLMTFHEEVGFFRLHQTGHRNLPSGFQESLWQYLSFISFSKRACKRNVAQERPGSCLTQLTFCLRHWASPFCPVGLQFSAQIHMQYASRVMAVVYKWLVNFTCSTESSIKVTKERKGNWFCNDSLILCVKWMVSGYVTKYKDTSYIAQWLPQIIPSIPLNSNLMLNCPSRNSRNSALLFAKCVLPA